MRISKNKINSVEETTRKRVKFVGREPDLIAGSLSQLVTHLCVNLELPVILKVDYALSRALKSFPTKSLSIFFTQKVSCE